MWISCENSRVPPQKRLYLWMEVGNSKMDWGGYLLLAPQRTGSLGKRKKLPVLCVGSKREAVAAKKPALCVWICSKAGLKSYIGRRKLPAAITASAAGVVPVVTT